MAEWSIATVLKTVNVKAFAGSNPVSPIKENKMPNDTLNYLSDKSEHDLLVILEGFKMLLADAELFDMLAEKLDLSDDVMIQLRDDVNNYIEDVV